jgi:hypothetical protein
MGLGEQASPIKISSVNHDHSSDLTFVVKYFLAMKSVCFSDLVCEPGKVKTRWKGMHIPQIDAKVHPF